MEGLQRCSQFEVGLLGFGCSPRRLFSSPVWKVTRRSPTRSHLLTPVGSSACTWARPRTPSPVARSSLPMGMVVCGLLRAVRARVTAALGEWCPNALTTATMARAVALTPAPAQRLDIGVLPRRARGEFRTASSSVQTGRRGRRPEPFAWVIRKSLSR